MYPRRKFSGEPLFPQSAAHANDFAFCNPQGILSERYIGSWGWRFAVNHKRRGFMTISDLESWPLFTARYSAELPWEQTSQKTVFSSSLDSLWKAGITNSLYPDGPSSLTFYFFPLISPDVSPIIKVQPQQRLCRLFSHTWMLCPFA